MPVNNTSIAVLTTDFKPMVGGIAEYLHHLWNEAARVRPVTVYTLVQQLGSEADGIRYRVERLPSPPGLNSSTSLNRMPLFRQANNLKNLHNMRRYAQSTLASLKQPSTGEVEAYIGVWDFTSHFWCEELRRLGIPYYIHTYGLELVRPLSSRLMRWREQDIKAAKGIIACSNGTAELLHDLNTQIQVINPGIDLGSPETVSGHEVAQLRSELRLPANNVVLTVCRLVPRKGVNLVLESIAELSGEFPDLCYIVAGDGPELASLKERAKELGIEERTRFMGSVDEATKWALYELADLFVLPNRTMGGTDWEGFGIVFLEAALCRKPSIGGNNGGASDAIEDGVTGLLINPEEKGALASSMRHLLRDDSMRHCMGQAALVRARKDFGWETIGAQFRVEQGW